MIGIINNCDVVGIVTITMVSLVSDNKYGVIGIVISVVWSVLWQEQWRWYYYNYGVIGIITSVK